MTHNHIFFIFDFKAFAPVCTLRGQVTLPIKERSFQGRVQSTLQLFPETRKATFPLLYCSNSKILTPRPPTAANSALQEEKGDGAP